MQGVRCKTVTFWSFRLFQNPQTIYLPRTIENVTAIRVKHLAWVSSVTNNTMTMIYLSCPELLRNYPAQSVILTNNPLAPLSGNQQVNIRSIIGTWCVSPQAANVTNYNNNDPQPLIELSQPTHLSQLTFTLESDGFGATSGVFGPCTVAESNQLNVTLELTTE